MWISAAVSGSLAWIHDLQGNRSLKVVEKGDTDVFSFLSAWDKKEDKKDEKKDTKSDLTFSSIEFYNVPPPQLTEEDP